MAFSASPGLASGALDQPGGHAFRVVEQHFQEMIGAELLVALAQSQALRGLHETLGAVGIFLEVHISLLGTGARPSWAREPPSSDRNRIRSRPADPHAASA